MTITLSFTTCHESNPVLSISVFINMTVIKAYRAIRNRKRIIRKASSSSASCRHKCAIALAKSAQAWALMMSKVLLPVIIFIEKNKHLLNKKQRNKIGSFDFTPNLLPVTQILKIKTSVPSTRINYVLQQVRKIRNELAHNLSLVNRTPKTYSHYGLIWGDLLSLIGEEKTKKEMLLALKKLNRSTSTRRRTGRRPHFKITNF